MQVTETQTDGLKREYKVVIEAKDIQAKVEDRLTEIGNTVQIPGFRPGKVPLQILKQRFGGSVMGEVLERAVNDSSNQAITERGLRPALQPQIEVTSFEEGGDLEYKIEMEVLPDIEPTDFAAIQLERIKITVPDSDVDEGLSHIAEQQKTTKALEEPRKAEQGDVLVIDFRGSVDGEELPGMAAEDHHLELGTNRFVEGFEDQLIGADKDEEREVRVTFPEDYVNDKLKGREAIFKVTVKDILASEPAAIDDDLAQAMGEENLESLRGKVRSQIESDYGMISRARLKRNLLDKLADSHDFPVPQGMVDAEFDAIWKQIEKDREEGQLDPEDEGKDEEALKGEYRDIAVRRVRLGLLLSEVGRLNEIDVAQDEVNRAMINEARKFPGQEREVLEFFQKTPQALANLRAPIFEDKVVDFIVDLADVNEREMTLEELRQEEAESDKGKDEEVSAGEAT